MTIPNTAVTQIQKITPGPPKYIAIATPEIFPRPTVAAIADESAYQCDTSPVAPSLSYFPRVMSIACLK